MKQILPLFFLSLFLMSCDYDQDFEFVPATQAAFFLMNENGQQQLRKVEADGSILPNWGENLGLAAPDDIAGNGAELWVSVASDKKLVLLDLETETQKQSFDLGDFQGHYLCMGSRYLLLSDTVNQALGFFHLKDQELIRISLNQRPGKAVYRSTKFFLQLGDQSVSIYNEQALAPYAELDFSRPIIDLVLDNRYSTWVISKDTQVYQSSISWNSNAIEMEAQPFTASKVRYSPYLQANFGKEFTRQLNLVNGRLANSPNPPADDFEVDFFESNIYFTFQDSLRIKDVFENEITILGPFTGIFRNAYFYLATASD